VRATTGVFDTERGFTGQVFDSGTGLGFYNARYYDTALGRFISPDSIVPDAAQPGLFNRFVYVSNNPLKYTDPTGHDEVCESYNVNGQCELWSRVNENEFELPPTCNGIDGTCPDRLEDSRTAAATISDGAEDSNESNRGRESDNPDLKDDLEVTVLALEVAVGSGLIAWGVSEIIVGVVLIPETAGASALGIIHGSVLVAAGAELIANAVCIGEDKCLQFPHYWWP
jgi:RHS repeat-associated protein